MAHCLSTWSEGKLIDVLPDRKAATVIEWLKEHPEVEIVSCDRGTDYAAVARKGAHFSWFILHDVTLNHIISKLYLRCIRAQASESAL